MIRTFGESEYHDENDAAASLKARFLEWRPELETNGEEVIILIAVKTPGNRGVQDIDLAVLVRLDNPLELELRVGNANRKIRIRNFCLTLEVKGHTSDRTRFRDNKIDVLYDDGWSGASTQAENQAKSLKRRIKNEVGSTSFCYALLWMVRLTEEQLRPLNSPNNALPATFSVEQMCRKFLSVNPPDFRHDGVIDIQSFVKLDFRGVTKRLTAEPAVGALDRKKVDRIFKQNIAFKNFEQLGETQQVVIGRAGSGKTMVLLKVALHLFNEGKRVALLTYNRTLVADLQRLLYHMGLKADSSQKNVNVMTLHAYFIALSRAILPEAVPAKITAAWLKREYANVIKEAREYLAAGAITRAEVQEKLRLNDFAAFDIACIDEGQDWPDDERDLLHLAIEAKNCIVAWGWDQLVRQDEPCDWTNKEKIATGETRLRKCMRMKSALASFVNLVAEELGMPEERWHVEPDNDISGGRVIIRIGVGGYLHSSELHESLLESNRAAGNENIDMLFCVPPSNLYRGQYYEGVASKLASRFRKLGYSVWDASVDANRDDPPRSKDDLRIVQFESSRGLEGWVVLLEFIDEFFDEKYGSYREKENEQQTFLNDDDFDAIAHAALWSLIPLTRAIDTLVITIKEESSKLGSAIIRAARRLPDVVTIQGPFVNEEYLDRAIVDETTRDLWESGFGAR